ncbi:hypothetical protein H8356DRAFT_1025262 [Neocallimastix lanati (nom. inval.)]|jgi:hypothetical protein|uniref:Elongator complex protein 5 n=1 Tax=Neocallimastix californiae TaxID=1754190 RepID=A0A1Y2DL23_9FUNG|nr:hypothetical protein H8356DRAFT_1025262 [Neocallimastix sp. JGI-2020a]ORY59864.1 hypothetical protein LY90DRAFT_701378 [Neocallimastix californiae]|eukprot:ORY59864.1 hypothetical protein LY90DRAFT_701378 [Neocallimastix californiae]
MNNKSFLEHFIFGVNQNLYKNSSKGIVLLQDTLAQTCKYLLLNYINNRDYYYTILCIDSLPIYWNKSIGRAKYQCIEGNAFSNLQDIQNKVKETIKSNKKENALAKNVVIIDSVNTLFIKYNYTTVLNFIQIIKEISNDEIQIILIYHQDIAINTFNGINLKSVLASIATTNILVEHTKKFFQNEGWLQDMDMDIIERNSISDAICTILHEKESGKMLRENIAYSLKIENNKPIISIIPVIELMKKYIPNYQNFLNDKKPTKKADPTENLTFNLNLTEEEKKTKNQLELPYLSVQDNDNNIAGSGEIYFDPELDDEFDDDDPDADLDF